MPRIPRRCTAGVGAELDVAVAALSVELSHAHDSDVDGRRERFVQCAGPRVSVVPRAQAYGDRHRRGEHDDDVAPRPADGRSQLRLGALGSPARGERHFIRDAVLAHRDHRIVELVECDHAAVAQRDELHVLLVVRRPSPDAQRHSPGDDGDVHDDVHLGGLDLDHLPLRPHLDLDDQRLGTGREGQVERRSPAPATEPRSRSTARPTRRASARTPPPTCATRSRQAAPASRPRSASTTRWARTARSSSRCTRTRPRSSTPAS